MKEFQVHVLIGVALAVAVALNGWAILRGRIFEDDLDIPGLVLEQGALAFTPTLLGTYHFSPNFENLEFKPLVFTQKLVFPDMSDLTYTSASVDAWTDKRIYMPRCLRLETFTSEKELFYLYGDTIMKSDGTGIDGAICQTEMDDPAAFARYDTWCDYPHLACMRGNYLLGCLSLHRLSSYEERNCGRINSLRNGSHWSGTATASLDWLSHDSQDPDNQPDTCFQLPTTTTTTSPTTATTTATTTTTVTTAATTTTTTTTTITTTCPTCLDSQYAVPNDNGCPTCEPCEERLCNSDDECCPKYPHCVHTILEAFCRAGIL
jgi:hypothetical protein